MYALLAALERKVRAVLAHSAFETEDDLLGRWLVTCHALFAFFWNTGLV